MSKHLSKIVITAIISALLLGCTTLYGPNPPVKYKFNKGLKKSEQWTKSKKKFDKYNEEELFYDNNGNLIKIISKDFFEGAGKKNAKVIVYETTYKVIDGYVVPETFKCNDELVCQLDYEKITSSNKGEIELDISSRFYAVEKTFMIWRLSYALWTFDLDRMWAPFMVDDKFVTENDSKSKELSLGYDNVVLKKYFYSYENLIRGLNKTYKGSMCGSPYSGLATSSTLKGSQFDLRYEWKGVADKPCLMKIEYNAKFMTDSTKSEVVMTYNDKGFRTSEEWNVNTSVTGGKKVTVFKQILEY